MRIIFAADHPRVLDGTYDQEGYTPKERRALARRRHQSARTVERQSLGNRERAPLSAADGSASASGSVHQRAESERDQQMFTTENVVAFYKKATLKITKNDEGEWRRQAEATLLIEPFTEALARELGDDIAAHLFADDGRLREELESIDLRVWAGLQHVTVRLDEATDPLAIIAPASVKDVTCSLKEDEKSGRKWLSCSFALVFSLEERTVRNFVLDHFGKALFWTFEAIQPPLEGLAQTYARSDEARPAKHTEH